MMSRRRRSRRSRSDTLPSRYVHLGQSCHHCMTETIVGRRYCCTRCRSDRDNLCYSLCRRCYANGVHQHHRLELVDPGLDPLHAWKTGYRSDVVLRNLYGHGALHYAAYRGDVAAVARLQHEPAWSDAAVHTGRRAPWQHRRRSSASMRSAGSAGSTGSTGSGSTRGSVGSAGSGGSSRSSSFHSSKTRHLVQNARMHWLQAACLGGQDRVLDWAIQRGITVTEGVPVDQDPELALQVWAVRGGHAALAQRLPQTSDQDAVNAAALYGRFDILQWLLQSTPALKSSAPLHFAAAGGHLRCVRYLVREKAADAASRREAPEPMGRRWPYFFTRVMTTPVVYKAAISGHVDVVQWLVERAGVSVSEMAVPSALSAAVTFGQIAVAQYLWTRLDAEERVDPPAELLHLAASEGHLPCVRWLVEDVGVPVSKPTIHGNMVQHVAASCGHDAVVRFLISQCDLPLDARNNRGEHVLHSATRGGSLSLVRWLVQQQRVSVAVTSSATQLPLHVAARRGHIDLVRLLLESTLQACADISPLTLLLSGGRPLSAVPQRALEMTQRLIVWSRGTTLLPEGLQRLTHLTSLAVHTQAIEELPGPVFCSLVGLTSLDVSHNRLVALPSELLGLPHLSSISAASNCLESVSSIQLPGGMYDEDDEYYEQLGGTTNPLQSLAELAANAVLSSKTPFQQLALPTDILDRYLQCDPTFICAQCGGLAWLCPPVRVILVHEQPSRMPFLYLLHPRCYRTNQYSWRSRCHVANHQSEDPWSEFDFF